MTTDSFCIFAGENAGIYNTLMKLNCPECNSNIVTQDMNLDNMMAKCSQCDELFSFGDLFKNTPPAYSTPRPDRITIQKIGSGLQLEYRWFTWVAIVFTLFTIFWNGFMLFFIINVIDIFSYTDGKLIFNGLGNLFPGIFLPHLWVGLFMIYFTLTLYINKTTIFVDPHQLQIRHSPLPWRGNHTIQRANIEQLYTKINHRNNGKGTYEVHAILKEDKSKKILSGLETSDFALYIEQELENYWGIQNRRVAGEYGR